MQDFERRAALARRIPEDFGDGWLSRNARDMVRIAAFAGFDMKDLCQRLLTRSMFSQHAGRVMNERTVCKLMDEMAAEYPTAKESA